MTQNKTLPGKFTWIQLASADPKKAQGFYGEVLGWKVQSFPMGSSTYEMILAGETMIGGYAALKAGEKPNWLSYVSVNDVDLAAKTAAANGGKILEAPHAIPTVGRVATIADPKGAALCLFHSDNGDPPDTMAKQGQLFWNELHTPDPKGALAFYDKVVGFTAEERDMGPSGKYWILNGSGTGRGGVTDHLEAGTPPHWLPYIYVEKVDETLARAKKLGAKLPVEGFDIPGIGRFGVIQDPVGAVIAVMTPLPREDMKM
jgi:predicted enzyme related to lactoylglutathione lyase